MARENLTGKVTSGEGPERSKARGRFQRKKPRQREQSTRALRTTARLVWLEQREQEVHKAPGRSVGPS